MPTLQQYNKTETHNKDMEEKVLQRKTGHKQSYKWDTHGVIDTVRDAQGNWKGTDIKR